MAKTKTKETSISHPQQPKGGKGNLGESYTNGTGPR